MGVNLFTNATGANYQAEAVRAFMLHCDGIDSSWCDEKCRYLANPTIARWENCREQGYVISMLAPDISKQLNIAFFEHRNSDEICAIVWEQSTTNAPTIETAEFGNVYKDKYDVTHSVDYGQVSEMAHWILNQLEVWWKVNA